MVADEATVYHSLFVEHSAEVVFAEEEDVVVGFALFFHNFSTFVGRKGLYLEDLFMLPEKRGRGYGKALLKYLANLAVERNCGRMEWICLDWNEPAIKVYRSIGDTHGYINYSGNFEFQKPVTKPTLIDKLRGRKDWLRW